MHVLLYIIFHLLLLQSTYSFLPSKISELFKHKMTQQTLSDMITNRIIFSSIVKHLREEYNEIFLLKNVDVLLEYPSANDIILCTSGIGIYCLFTILFYEEKKTKKIETMIKQTNMIKRTNIKKINNAIFVFICVFMKNIENAI